jgi:hypothetical protein
MLAREIIKLKMMPCMAIKTLPEVSRLDTRGRVVQHAFSLHDISFLHFCNKNL